jgi:dihydroflavonol-4-reductase
VDGTANVVNAALRAGVRRLAHVSSIAALGLPDNDAIIDETSSRTPADDAYARSKYHAELEIQRGIAEGLDAAIVNPSLVFGTGRAGTNTRRIVDAVRMGWMPGVPAGSTNVVDVEDVADGLRRAMARGRTGERYILGSENLSWQAIVRTLAEAFGVEPPSRTIPPALLTAVGALAEGAAWITRQPPRFTRSLARAASNNRRYSNQKAVDELGCSFRPFAETARRIARDLQETAHAPTD